MLLWSPHLQRFLSGRDSDLPMNQLRWVITQCCVMVAHWGHSSQGRECWQLYPELAALAFLSCAKATLTDLCRNPMEIGQGKI